MEFITLFETIILVDQCDIDNHAVISDCKQHSTREPSVQLSNAGGYQGHNFISNVLFDEIRRKMPQRSDRMLKSYEIQAWLNVNGDFAWNDIHSHQDDGVLLSGVYYVKAAANAGDIRLYDPRFMKGKNLYDNYYNEGKGNYISIVPKDQTLLFFPPWLHHMVEPNQSGTERISIAFNIINPRF
jgi:uncharacterized protein (TIGR02466 family)